MSTFEGEALAKPMAQMAVGTISEKSRENWPAAKIRDTFVGFFVEKHGHTHWPSSSVVPHEDPTLLFANAGMNQYKSVFLGAFLADGSLPRKIVPTTNRWPRLPRTAGIGTVDPNTSMAKLKRAANSQKCIRAGGKHNDLDDVGKDLYHHTFFEMLGNWSFGDYFKEQAIAMAWECLTVAFGLDPDRLYVTYFGGDELRAPGVPSDEETRRIWLKYVPAERVLPFDCGDNFWEMGDTGPCGPCTEIHYDRIGGRDAAHLVNLDDPNVLEIWNNVFIQYNRDASGLKSLPNQHVDTGMGFERLASILQGQMSNYDTDVFTPLFAAIQELSGFATPYRGRVGAEDTGTIDMAYRVVADHVRTLSFAIADGAVPDALGRGYVLRRILRRAVWYSQRFLGVKASDGPFVARVVDALVATLGGAFPELARGRDTIVRVLEGEERDFNRTIDKGARFFSKKADALQKDSTQVFAGVDAFHLSGSLGFPLDLTQIMAEERGMTVDVEGYHAALAFEKESNASALAARKARRSGAIDLTMAAEQTAAMADSGISTTVTDAKYVWNERLSAKVLAIFLGRGAGPKGDGFVDFLTGDEPVAGLVLDATSFYAEMGGQTFDTGSLMVDDEAAVFVEDVQVYGGYVVHIGSPNVALKVGDAVACSVDYDRRTKIAPNHTMTHVLNFALREVLLGGAKAANKAAEDGVAKCVQRGSFVDAERLRFDFSWDAPLEADQLAAVEAIVCGVVSRGVPVDARDVPLSSAMAIGALRAMKGESYPDPVRVVAVGAAVGAIVGAPDADAWDGLSIELCGGTHISNTSEAVGFALLEETGISKGVRRIVGCTREFAAAAHAHAQALREQLAVLQSMPLRTEADVEAFQAAHKAVRADVDAHDMPAHEKKKGRDALADLAAGPLKDAQKRFADARAAAASAAFEKLADASAALDDAKAFAVARIDFGSDAKLWQTLQKAVLSKRAPKASFCVVTQDSGKLVVFTNVTDAHLAAGLDAREWCKAAADAAGTGKGGGKPNAANMIVAGDGADAAVAAAKAFAASKL
ncbi:tRNA synthetases class II (A)-domain-containing protein [Pelagophyceae sp. CCMP2097]|nr:tRNA synthetases class II (A)-domain-containing protein [Pelagophyceae sp. CCMP2097]